MVIFLVILIVAGGCLLLFMYKEALQNNITINKLSFSDFPESFGKVTIFFISDIHKRIIPEKIINSIKNKAQLVIIGGDLTEKGVPIKHVERNLLRLKQIGPVYFVWGNNDYEIGYHKLTALLKELDIRILANTADNIQSGEGETISLLGVKELNRHQDRLDLALATAGDDSFKILVSHYPDIVKKLLPEHQIRLVLSGHTHGGQIRLLGYGPYKRGGIEKLESTVLLISNGFGTTAIPLRLGAPAECHLLTLERGSENRLEK